MADFQINDEAACSSAKSSGHPTPSKSRMAGSIAPGPYWNGADLLLAADCVPAAHAKLLRKKLSLPVRNWRWKLPVKILSPTKLLSV
jgi:hypothetical protein